jgi:class 3 adenylate cyclase
MSRGRALHVGEALYRDMGAGARRDFTCLGTFQNLAARLEKWAPVSDELWSLWANSLLRDELAPRVAPDPMRSRYLYFTVRSAGAPIVRVKRWKLD